MQQTWTVFCRCRFLSAAFSRADQRRKIAGYAAFLAWIPFLQICQTKGDKNSLIYYCCSLMLCCQIQNNLSGEIPPQLFSHLRTSVLCQWSSLFRNSQSDLVKVTANDFTQIFRVVLQIWHIFKKTAQAKVIVLLIHQFFPQYDVKDLNNMTIKLNL